MVLHSIKKQCILGTLIVLLFSCNPDIETKEKDLVKISQKIINIDARLLSGQHIVRKLDTKKLEKDTIYYVLDRDGLYSSNTDDYAFYIKFSIHDIILEPKFYNEETEMIVRFDAKEGCNIEYGKFVKSKGETLVGWQGKSKFMTLNYPLNINKIKSDFEYYNAYSFKEGIHMNTDLVTYDFMDTNDLKSGIESYFEMLSRYLSETNN